tara:strand:- start:74 stop:1270 length:1197 start_codon:yes stop_codon:yes gene_type:complete
MVSEKLQKKPLTIKIKNKHNEEFKFTGSAQFKSFQQCYAEWESQTRKLKGETIGNVDGTDSLYDIILKQGVTGRYSAGDGGAKHPQKGGVIILNLLTKIANATEITEKLIDELTAVKDLMSSIDVAGNKGEINPRNIVFTNPVRMNKRGIKIGNGKIIYGHYRTPQYYEQTKRKNKYNGKTKVIRPVDSDWWKSNTGESKNPMWQALYAKEGETSLDGLTISLQQCVIMALETIEEAPLGLSRDTPIPVERAGGWKKALMVTGIKRIALDWIKKPTPKGFFRTKRFMSTIANKRIRIPKGKKAEQNAVKELLGINLPNDIHSAYFSITRRQTNRLVDKLLRNRRKKAVERNNFNDLRIVIPDEKPKEDVKQPKDDSKLTSNDRKIEDWRDIMKREMIC